MLVVIGGVCGVIGGLLGGFAALGIITIPTVVPAMLLLSAVILVFTGRRMSVPPGSA
jgi:hypothetical protein